MNTNLEQALNILGTLRVAMSLKGVPHIVTKSGVAVSVQGSEAHYCSPQEDYLASYGSYEVMLFPPKGQIMTIPEGFEHHSRDGVLFGWLPVDKLEVLVDHFGGVDFPKTFERIQSFTVRKQKGIVL